MEGGKKTGELCSVSQGKGEEGSAGEPVYAELASCKNCHTASDLSSNKYNSLNLAMGRKKTW